MDLLTIQEQLQLLSNTINMIDNQKVKNPWDRELLFKSIKVHRHLMDHIEENESIRVNENCNYCLSDPNTYTKKNEEPLQPPITLKRFRSN